MDNTIKMFSTTTNIKNLDWFSIKGFFSILDNPLDTERNKNSSEEKSSNSLEGEVIYSELSEHLHPDVTSLVMEYLSFPRPFLNDIEKCTPCKFCRKLFMDGLCNDCHNFVDNYCGFCPICHVIHGFDHVDCICHYRGEDYAPESVRNRRLSIKDSLELYRHHNSGRS